MSSCHKQPNNGGRVGVLVVDVVEMAVDGKLAEDEPNFRARVEPWRTVWMEPGY